MDSKPKRPARSARFVLQRELGAGAYNCAFLLDNGSEVLRVGYLPNDPEEEESRKGVLRGIEMVHVFQSFGNLLGPSLLQEMSIYNLIDESELGQYVRGNLCSQIEESRKKYALVDGNEFALQHIEYLNGGVFNNDLFQRLRFTRDEVCFCMFSLVWFFASAQQYFSFRHHDLKSQNVMVRALPNVGLFTFSLDNAHTYQFKSNVVPVVIDYDFATVFTSRNPEDRNVGGTRHTCPPDAAIYLLHHQNGSRARIAYNEQTYDWWSLGVCMLELVCPFALWHTFADMQDAFTQRWLDNLSFLDDGLQDWNRDMVATLMRSCCFAAVVNNTSMQPPALTAYGILAKTKTLWDGWDAILRAHPDWQRFRQALSTLDANAQSLLRQLLAWDPKVRNANDYPMDVILKSPYFARFKLKKYLAGAPFTGSNVRIMENQEHLQDIDVKDHPWLAMQICSECRVQNNTPMFACSCCARAYCGAECQAKTHTKNGGL